MKPSIIIDPIILNDNIKDLHLLLNTIIKENFFSVIEIWDTLEGSILDIIKSNSCHVIFDVNLSPLMSSMNYDLSSNDAEIRCRSLMHVYNRIELLRKYGVKCISLSAPSQNNIDRKNKIELFKNSLISICKVADRLDMMVSIEAFDTSVDKKRILGNSLEVKQFMDDVRLMVNNVYLTWDLGHMCLNSDDFLFSLLTLHNYIYRVHLSNYSLNKDEWFYGDKHLPFGRIGQINQDDLIKIYNYLAKLNFSGSLAVEIASNRLIEDCCDETHTYDYIRRVMIELFY